jgi:hypothetical protein
LRNAYAQCQQQRRKRKKKHNDDGPAAQTPPGKKNKNGQVPMTRLDFFKIFFFFLVFPLPNENQ